MQKVNFPKELTEDTEKHVLFFIEKMMESIAKNLPNTIKPPSKRLQLRTVAMERAIGSLILSFLGSLLGGNHEKLEPCCQMFINNLKMQMEANFKDGGLEFKYFDKKKT